MVYGQKFILESTFSVIFWPHPIHYSLVVGTPYILRLDVFSDEPSFYPVVLRRIGVYLNKFANHYVPWPTFLIVESNRRQHWTAIARWSLEPRIRIPELNSI
jgi:hypothetical protein